MRGILDLNVVAIYAVAKHASRADAAVRAHYRVLPMLDPRRAKTADSVCFPIRACLPIECAPTHAILQRNHTPQ